MVIKKIILFALIITLILSFPSCTKNLCAEDMLFEITKEIDDLPPGILYLKNAPEGNVSHIPHSMLRALYNENALEYEFTLIEDFAVYISAQKPCEVAVYKCYSASDTDVVATMCLKRIDTLRTSLEGTPYGDIPKNAKVNIKGKFVSVIMT